MEPWILLLTTCAANLALGNMEHSISVVINVCAAVLSTAQLLPSHVTPLPKRQAPACTTAKSTFKMPSGTIVTALLGMIHSATARRGGIADALTPERRILPILRELPGHGTVLVLACILLMTFAAVCCYYCHQATRGATAHLEPGTLNDMDQPNAVELGLLQPECLACAKSPRQLQRQHNLPDCTRWTTDCACKPDNPYDDNSAQLSAIRMDLDERQRILRMINAQCNGVDIDAFIEVVKLGEDYYILRISPPTCM